MSIEGSAQDGQRFGKYSLLDRIAVTSMAEVFIAREAGAESLDKTIVLKRVHSDLSKQKSFVRVFLEEARLAAQLHHPNIVQVYDLGKVRESYFVATEYVIGRDLRQLMTRAERAGVAFPLPFALELASTVCEALAYAHQKCDLYGAPLNVVHRDIAPENIVLCADGTVKLLGFGLARAANQIEQSRSHESSSAKLSYRSPEQCTGQPVDARSDVFSLGVVLYELATGFRLFTGADDVEILRSITEGKIYAPRYFKADIPEAVEAILLKALEKDRERRYATAAEMQADIDRYLATFEFKPSASHFANLLRQVFGEELEAERVRLREPAARPIPTLLEVVEEPVSNNPPIPLRIRTADRTEPANDEREETEKVLTVSVTDEVYGALKDIAERNRLPVGALVREILSGYVRFK